MYDDVEKKELDNLNKTNKYLRRKKLLKNCQEYGMIAQVPFLLLSYGLSIKVIELFGVIPNVSNIFLLLSTFYAGISYGSYKIYKEAYKNIKKQHSDLELENETLSSISEEIKINSLKKEQLKETIEIKKTKQEQIEDLKDLRKSFVEDTVERFKTYTK